MLFFSLLALAVSLGTQSADALSTTIPLTRRTEPLKFLNGTVNFAALNDELLRTTLKFTGQSRLRKSAINGTRVVSKRDNVALSLRGYSTWTGPVYIGTPLQTFQIYFDSGSSDFTVADSSCTAANCDNGTPAKARYNVAASSTSQNTGEVVTSNFADGTSSSGVIIKDSVVVGSLGAPGQSIISATSFSSTVKSLPSDGIMGLAFPGVSSDGSYSVPFTQYYSGGAPGLFGMRLSNTAGKSQITFGGISRSKVGGTIKYYPVATSSGQVSQTYWQMALSAPNIAGRPALSTRVNHIIDSGTTLIVAPPAGAADFWSRVPGSAKYDDNYYTFPCASPPSVSFSFGRSTQYQYTVAASDLIIGMVSSTSCLGAIVAQDLGLGTSWLLGDTFILSWYTVFDIANNRIGFAPPQ